jgi:hypothetical protein
MKCPILEKVLPSDSIVEKKNEFAERTIQITSPIK